MNAQYEKELREKGRVIAHLKKKVARSQRENMKVREHWIQVADDLFREQKAADKKYGQTLKSINQF